MLSEAHPESVVDLSMQYRMNEDIMCLSNELIYEGRLKCGSEEVMMQGLKLGEKVCGAKGCKEETPCWISSLMDERFATYSG
jgi:DNA replication ATP-dependent helicase Dna2